MSEGVPSTGQCPAEQKALQAWVMALHECLHLLESASGSKAAAQRNAVTSQAKPLAATAC